MTAARFVHLGDDLYVNPAHVVAVGPSDRGAVVETVNGTSQDVAMPVAELVALLRGL